MKAYSRNKNNGGIKCVQKSVVIHTQHTYSWTHYMHKWMLSYIIWHHVVWTNISEEPDTSIWSNKVLFYGEAILCTHRSESLHIKRGYMSIKLHSIVSQKTIQDSYAVTTGLNLLGGDQKKMNTKHLNWDMNVQTMYTYGDNCIYATVYMKYTQEWMMSSTVILVGYKKFHYLLSLLICLIISGNLTLKTHTKYVK
jgi:hypothetical protein